MCPFGASWLCSLCGQDFCSQCLAELKVTLHIFLYISLIHIQNNDAHLSCVSSTEHELASFISCSRYTEADILHIMNVMGKISKSAAPPVLCTQTFVYKHDMITEAELKSSILRILAGHLKATEFRYFLAKQIPLVITDLSRKLQLSWSPSHLMNDYGADICLLEDCEENQQPVKSPLKAFLSRFMISDGAKEVLPYAIWRIKVHVWFSELTI